MSADAAEILGLLSSSERLRVVAALVLGASTTADVVAATTLPRRAVLAALARLEQGGLVDRDDTGSWQLLIEQFAAARPSAPAAQIGHFPAATPEEAAVLQRFIRAGRLLSIPMQHAKRLVILDYLAKMFEPGQRYTEKQVNAMIGDLHDDYAALRRYLVDEGLLSRDAGVYWRTGGTVEV
ncbi:MAG: hypothetical protein QOG53_3061 [Frankiales bacterium]|nr:hypothetical protein [Frankiales bacterium]